MDTNQTEMAKIKPKDIIGYKDVAVVTTRMLAGFYRTEINNIQVNFQRNREWFVEGKHYYNLEGEERKKWHLLLTQSKQKNVEMRGRSLILWTQRGVGQHARMINTPEAWTLSDFGSSSKSEQSRISCEIVGFIYHSKWKRN